MARITFNPERLGYYEKAGWQAYYDRDWLRAFMLLVRLNREQFRMSLLVALAAALDTVRASLAFAPVDNDVPKATKYIARFYAKAFREQGITADAHMLAEHEMNYWLVHRQLAQRRKADPSDADITPMIDALAQLHASLFDSTPTAMRHSAKLRALAAVAVDRITSKQSTDVDADWDAVEQYLQACYRAVLAELGAASETQAADEASNEYRFITHWRVQATLDEVAAIIGNAPDLVRWWPSVYLDVQELEPGDSRSIGKVVSLYTRGWLPYTLRWQLRVTDVRDDGFALAAQGDFVGRGIWTFVQDGAWVNITYDWQIRADKPLLRYGSLVFKPIFSANHRWAMRQGERSLCFELQRRRAASDYDRARIPAPPRPPRIVGAVLLAGAAVLLCGLYWMKRAFRSAND